MINKTIVNKVLIFAIITSLCFGITGCGKKAEPKPDAQKAAATITSQTVKSTDPLNEYIITGEILPNEKKVTASEVVNYVNAEKVNLNEIYFHLYPNAFKTKETAPFLFDSFAAAYPSGFSEGSITISAITLNGKPLDLAKDTSISGKDSTILKVALSSPLKPTEKAELKISFELKLPPAAERFGIGSNYINLGNWYPIAAVYDKSGWNLDPYYAIGDPFYSDTANYTVSLSAPEKFTLAASGTLTEKVKRNNNNMWSFTAYSMRDFAVIGSDIYETAEGMAGKTKVISYYYKEDAALGKRALEFGIKSINTFNEKFGTYPYPTYSVCETAFPSGMEYPGLVYISKDLYKAENDLNGLALTTIHETGHQYFYSLVGDDQIDEAWLDEAFATYSEITYLEKNLGAPEAKEQADYNIRAGQVSMESKVFDGNVVKPLSAYKNWDDYGPAVYNVGVTLLIELRKSVGDKVFWNIMQTYFKEYEFKIATTEDFKQVCAKVSNKNMDGLFKKYLGYTSK